jgi:large exoprotein involved in heme utilization and adhesion
VELANVSGLIAQGCSALGENEFIITGCGGLPPSPSDQLSNEAVVTNWSTLDSDVENRPDVENRSSAAPATNSTKVSTPTQIMEAQGWVINNKGEVVLTANAPNATAHNPWMPSANCHASQNPS